MEKQIFIENLFVKAFSVALFIVMLSVFTSAQTVSDVDAIVQKAIDAKVIPGAGIAVVRDGKVILTKGYGAADIEVGTTANENTVYQIASVTKQFTAAGIMLLVEDGKVKLDDTLGQYVPDVPEKWRGVTVRQLMNQVSGIPNYTAGGKLVSEKTYTKAEILGLVTDVPVGFEPGTQWQYSNTNYFLLGMIIEKASGKSYPDFMSERIFKPLGMNSTRINTSGLKIENVAVGYRTEAGSMKKAALDNPSQPYAAGAIVSTPADMAKWALALAEGKVLKKSSWDEVWTPAKLSDGKATDYGFGWQVRKFGEVNFTGHSGGISGFSSYIARFPDDNLSVVVLVNSSTGGATQGLAFDIAGLYLPKFASALAAQRAAKTAAATATIEDTDPATTKFVRETFEKMIAGDVDPNLFTPEMQKVLFPTAINQLKPFLSTQGAIKAFDLVTADNPQNVKRRVYRVTFESGTKINLTFTLNTEGKIAGALVRPE